MKVLVLRAAGTNCDRETQYAFERAGARAESRHVNELLARPELLRDYGILAIPGGFSYGDDVRGGRVLAAELRQRVLPEALRFIERGGLALGICNGFQVLVQTGLLPGRPDGERTVTLTHNDSHRYEDSWVELEVPTDRCAFVRQGERYFIPIAHAEGKFVAERETLDELEENGQVVFRYLGRNPNGSLNDIAGICDPTGRVLGLMPHPERHLEGFHHPYWTRAGLKPEGDGLRVFRNAVSATT